MTDWRAETSGDLRSALAMLESLRASISGEPTPDQLTSIWKIYLNVEKSVAFVKIELGEENPNKFVNMRPYKVPDERQALQFAGDYLKKGELNFAAGNLSLCLKELRESRNYLRVLLREKQLAKGRRARTKGRP
jgi:hypothetical protein